MNDGTTQCPRCGFKATATPAKEGNERWRAAADGMSYVVEEYVCARCGLYYMDTSLESDEKDPDRFKIQLWAEQETIKNATTMMEFKEVSVNPSKDGKIMKFEMKMESTQRSAGTHASSWGHELFEAIEEMGYRIWWMSPDWVSNRLMIIIRKEVVR